MAEIESLRLQRTALQTALDSLPQFMILVDKAQNIAAFNRQAFLQTRKAFGQEIVVGAPIADFIWKKNLPGFQKNFEAALSGEMRRTETLLQVQPNREIWYEAIYSPARTDSGEIIGVNLTAVPINERKAAEAELREKESFLQGIADTTPVILFTFDLAQQKLTYINNAFTDILGYDKEMILTRPEAKLLTLVHPDDLPNLVDKLPTLTQRNKGDILESEHRIRHQDGRWRWMAVRLTLFRQHADGTPIDLLGTAQDITQQQAIQAALQESEARYRSLTDDVLNSSSVGIFILDDNFHVVWINDAMENFFGISKEKVIGKDKRQLIKNQFQNLFYESEKFADRVLNTYDNNSYSEFFEIQLKSHDTVRWLQHWSQPIQSGLYANGRIEHYTDITQRKEAELAQQYLTKRLQTLRHIERDIVTARSTEDIASTALEHVQELIPCHRISITALDPKQKQGRILYLRSTSGDPSREESVFSWQTQSSNGFTNLEKGDVHQIPDLDAWPGENPIIAKLRRDGIRSIINIPLLAKDSLIGTLNIGSRHPNAFSPEHLEILQEVASFLALALQQARLYEQITRYTSDLEQRVAVRTEALMQANQRLEELDELKSKLIDDISHELRTPVTNLKLYLDLLQKGRPEKQAQYISVLRQQAQQLETLSEGIIQLSRLQLKFDSTTFTVVYLDDLIHTTILSRQRWRTHETITFTYQPAPKLPPIMGSFDHLANVMINIVSNAFKYTLEGEVRLSTAVTENGEEVLVAVRDTGIGIPEGEMSQLFDAFYRGKAVAQLNIPGIGLGLAIAQRIVAMHNGRIQIESEPNQGTTVRIWLPVKR